MGAAFARLDREPQLPARVATRIAREIVEGRLRPGDRLPSEQQLSASFKVSRNVVREAIARLRADGVVESRHGIGAFVVEPARRSTLTLDAEGLGAAETRALFELRAVLEIEAAGLAAGRATAAQEEAIAAELTTMRLTRSWDEEGTNADLAFHRAVALATANSYIATFVTFIAEQMRATIAATRTAHSAQSLREVTVAEHERVHAAIARGDAAGAREAMRAHIDGAARRLGLH